MERVWDDKIFGSNKPLKYATFHGSTVHIVQMILQAVYYPQILLQKINANCKVTTTLAYTCTGNVFGKFVVNPIVFRTINQETRESGKSQQQLKQTKMFQIKNAYGFPHWSNKNTHRWLL